MTIATLPTRRVSLAERRLPPVQHLTADVAKAAEGEDPGTISGTACRYGVELDRGYGLFMVLEAGCFAAQVKDPARVMVLWQHDTDSPIGRLSGLDDHADRLDFTGTILDSPKVPDGQKALELLREGITREVSVGFRIQKYTRVVDEEADTVTYRILKAWLQELSMVTFGAFGDDATVDEVNSLGGAGVAVLEARRIRAELAGLMGMMHAVMTGATGAVCSCGWAVEGTTDLDAAIAAHVAEARARRDDKEQRIRDTFGDPDAPLIDL